MGLRLLQPEYRGVADDSEREAEIAELRERIAGIEGLLEVRLPLEKRKYLVSGGARDRLEPTLAEYKKRLAELTREEELPRSA